MTFPTKKNMKKVKGMALTGVATCTQLTDGGYQKNKEKESPAALNVHQLFSLFTADIIKKNSVFER